MNFFAIELPSKVEIFGVPLLINPATLFVTALLLVLTFSSLIYWLRQRSSAKVAYVEDFDFYGPTGFSAIENKHDGSDVRDLQVMHLRSRLVSSENGAPKSLGLPSFSNNGLVSSENGASKSLGLPSFSNNAPAYQTYVNGGDHLPKAFGSD